MPQFLTGWYIVFSSPAKTQLIPFKETNAVTKYLLDPRWDTFTDSPAFPHVTTERLIDVHLKCVVYPFLEHNRR